MEGPAGDALGRGAQPEPHAGAGADAPSDPAARWTGRARVVAPTPAAPEPVALHPAPAAVGRGGYGPGVYGPGAPGPQRTKRRLRPRWGRIALVVASVLALCLAGSVLGGWLYANSLNDRLKRTDPFSALTGDRPPVLAEGAMNILMLGSDSRDPDAPVDTAGKWRADTLILMHIPASHDKAYLINFPRDLWVHIPRSQDGNYGNTMAKINAAYAWGGVPLTVQTVEGYTGVRIDHIALIDFGGFVQVTDALGGVDLYVERQITSIHKPFRTFLKGTNHLTGAEALDYIRQRKQFPDGDFARMRHQQMFLKALMDKAASTGTLTNPAKLNAFLTSVTDAMTVDKDFSLLSMAIQFRSLRSNDLVFMTSPYSGTDTIDGQSVVVSDKTKALALFDAVARDQVADWLARNPSAKSPDTAAAHD
jgi:LCP family protein required for cell wall assembly